MDKDRKDLESQKTKLEEQAINKDATQGKDINHQVKDKKNHHQPRDTA